MLVKGEGLLYLGLFVTNLPEETVVEVLLFLVDFRSDEVGAQLIREIASLRHQHLTELGTLVTVTLDRLGHRHDLYRQLGNVH